MVTDGEVFRKLDGVPYTGLTLQADGLHLHINEDPDEVLAQGVLQTWAFYDRCPLIYEREAVVDTEWQFSNEKNIRTIIFPLEGTNYGILTVTDKTSKGMTLVECTALLQETVDPDWAFNLDGGPSSALLARDAGDKKLKTIYGNRAKDIDVLAFCELEE